MQLLRKHEQALLAQLARLIVDHPGQVIRLIHAHRPPGRTYENGKQILQSVFRLLEQPSFRKSLLTLLERDQPGDSYVQAIAGAVGSVANLFGAKQQSKLAQQQANAQTLQMMLAYKAQKEAQVASHTAAQQARAGNEKLIKMAGGAAALGLVGWMLLKPSGHQGPHMNRRQVTQ